MRKLIKTPESPQPSGTYSQGLLASGPFLFVSGQTPRLPNGQLPESMGVGEQTRRTMENVSNIAKAAGLSLKNAVHLTIYLTDMRMKPDFEEVYQSFFSDNLPARIVVQSTLIGFDVEISAIFQAG